MGPKHSAGFAVFAALGMVFITLLISFSAVWKVPWHELPHRMGTLRQSPGHLWIAFVSIVLALSGVEAIANLTGVMKKPVYGTAGRAIWIVAIVSPPGANANARMGASPIPRARLVGVESRSGPRIGSQVRTMTPSTSRPIHLLFHRETWELSTRTILRPSRAAPGIRPDSVVPRRGGGPHRIEDIRNHYDAT